MGMGVIPVVMGGVPVVMKWGCRGNGRGACGYYYYYYY
jgi:hypothetical protein